MLDNWTSRTGGPLLKGQQIHNLWTYHHTLPSLKRRVCLGKLMDGRLISFWDGLFSGSVSTSTSSSSLAASKWPWLPLVQLRTKNIQVHPWKNLKITCFSKETSSFHPPSFFGVPNVNLQGVVGYLVTIDGNDSKPRFCQVFRRMMTRLRVEKKRCQWWISGTGGKPSSNGLLFIVISGPIQGKNPLKNLSWEGLIWIMTRYLLYFCILYTYYTSGELAVFVYSLPEVYISTWDAASTGDDLKS